MKNTLRLTALLLSMLLAGCFFTKESYHPVRYFDIGKPEAGKYTAAVRTVSFTSAGPYKFDVVYRTQQNELVKDDYNKWIQTPETMLENYIRICFASPDSKSDEGSVRVAGRILIFEVDITKNETVISVEYKISANDKTIEKTVTYKSTLKDKSPESIAEAMSGSAAKFAALLDEEIKKLK